MEKKHKKWLWAAILVFVLNAAIVLTILFWPEGKNKTTDEEKIATVNGVEITRAAFNNEMRPLLREISERETKPTDSQLLHIKKNVLEKIIVNELLYQESMKDGIVVEDTAVRERVGQIKKRYSKDGDFNKELANIGMSEEDFIVQIKKEMTIQQYVYKKFVEHMRVTEREISDYYKKYVKERIRQNLKQTKAQEELDAYVKKLKEKAAIKSYLEFDK